MIQARFRTRLKALRLSQIRRTSKILTALESSRLFSTTAIFLKRIIGLRTLFQQLVGYRRLFPTLRDAELAAQPFADLSPGTAEYASLHLELSESTRPSDYAALFHLNAIIKEADGPTVTVFDLGGCVGNLFYSYIRYLDQADRLRWRVHDLPLLLKEAKRIAEQRGEGRLSFAETLAEIEGADVLLISGALHYLPVGIDAVLRELDHPPKQVIINRTPLTDGPTCATVQDANGFLMPCRLLNRRELVAGLEGAGYDLADQWTAAELSLKVPLEPACSVATYSGLYFRRRNALE